MSKFTKLMVRGLLRKMGSRRMHQMVARVRRADLTRELLGACGNRVLAGPFAGMKLVDAISWGDGDFGPKLLGCYEANLHESLRCAAARAPTSVINVGCAEGYYAVGLARLLPQATVYAFDIDAKARDTCMQAAAANDVGERVVARGRCMSADLSELIGGHAGRTFLLMDCEGGEHELLDPAFTPELSRCDMLVETHDFFCPGISATLIERFRATHDIEIFRQGARDPNQAPQLDSWSEYDRWLMVNESRPGGMLWLACWSRAA